MPTLNLSSSQAAVYIIGGLEIVFLVALIIVYQFGGNTDLRPILKDVFLGWNTALALSLNTSGKQNGPPPNTTNVEEHK